MKKLSSLLLALILCLGVPVASAAESDFQIRDGVLVKYTGEDQFLTIPDSVTAIGEEAFADCGKLKVLVIPGSVTRIEDNAFDCCEDLTIHAPEGSYAQSFAKENNIPFIAI